MVNNPEWVKHSEDWKKTVNSWVSAARPEQVMKLAIVADAHAVAGNRTLLTPIKEFLIDKMANQELILTEFTRPALSFSIPLTLFGNVKSSKEGVDIKAGGIFPIVHGIRALSLEYALDVNNTFDRLTALQGKKVLEKETAENLSEALKLFMKLRLTQQLSQQHSHNKIELKLLERTERDLLRHSLHVVKKFKQWLGYHYQIRE
jgi:CBS domain-containing protein